MIHSTTQQEPKHIEHTTDFCVVGGGLAGLCAAVAAARHGSQVVLVQDRPVFGGNASSEIRMWVCGAHGYNRRETGIIEELELENVYRNPNRVYSIWDTILWETVRAEPGITALLNCSVYDADTDTDEDGRASLTTVHGWQTTTQTRHTVHARMFADCSGDSVLAPLTGAEYRLGREASSEFGESIEPQQSDRKTMGMSCLIQARELDHPVPFIRPSWARYYESPDDLPFRDLNPFTQNYWWIELGSENDAIGDTERLRDRLLAEVYGVWDLVKNRSGIEGVENLEIDFIGFLPGKRESRRYVGDHMISQTDVESGGKFRDCVAYAGWSMDDHHPGGIDWDGKPTVFHPAPSPWGIPFRSLYSRNVSNLLCAGRNIGASHIALASSRVMRTCSVIGQAAGSAAHLCVKHRIEPRKIGTDFIDELQQLLMDDDCWLPGFTRRVSAALSGATLTATAGDPEPLRSGVDRPVEQHPDDAELQTRNPKREVDPDSIAWISNAWRAPIGAQVTLDFDAPLELQTVRIVFDSDLNRYYRDMRMRYGQFRSDRPVEVSPCLVRAFTVSYRARDGVWKELFCETENRTRLYRRTLPSVEASAVRLTIDASWGNATVNVFGFDCG